MLIFANVLPKPKSFMAATLISPEITTLQTIKVYENEKYHTHHISLQVSRLMSQEIMQVKVILVSMVIIPVELITQPIQIHVIVPQQNVLITETRKKHVEEREVMVQNQQLE